MWTAITWRLRRHPVAKSLSEPAVTLLLTTVAAKLAYVVTVAAKLVHVVIDTVAIGVRKAGIF